MLGLNVYLVEHCLAGASEYSRRLILLCLRLDTFAFLLHSKFHWHMYSLVLYISLRQSWFLGTFTVQSCSWPKAWSTLLCYICAVGMGSRFWLFSVTFSVPNVMLWVERDASELDLLTPQVCHRSCMFMYEWCNFLVSFIPVFASCGFHASVSVTGIISSNIIHPRNPD